jgi:hypothetical protein
MEGSHVRHVLIFAMLHDNPMTSAVREECCRSPKLIHKMVIPPLAEVIVYADRGIHRKYMIMIIYLSTFADSAHTTISLRCPSPDFPTDLSTGSNTAVHQNQHPFAREMPAK